ASRLSPECRKTLIWWRGWDSNPRYGGYPYNGFRDRLLQPLGHLSTIWDKSPRRIAISYYKSNLHRLSRGKPRQTISRSLCGFRRAASGKNPSEAIRPLRPTPRKPLRPDG